MSKKNIRIFLCIILIIAFFLPYLSAGPLRYSGLNVVFGKQEVGGLNSSGRSLFLCLLIPVGAILVLIGSTTNDSFTSSGFLRWMPIVGVAYIIVMLFLQAEGNGGMGVGDFIGVFGYGLWITIVAAIILPFIRE